MQPTERTSEVLGQLEAGIDAILDSESFTRYLAMLATFHHYSFSNVLLILEQCPDATQVAGYRKWQQLGRQVRKGERGIRILVPHRRKLGEDEDGEPVYGVPTFGLGTVFDVRQTDGDELPQRPTAGVLAGDADLARSITHRLTETLTEQGIIVTTGTLPGTVRGAYEPQERRITLRADLPPLETCSTLVHEAAHHLAGHRAGMDRRDAETVAECAAYVVLAHVGLDSGAKSFAYVAAWAQDRAVLKRNLTAIQQTADALITTLTTDAPEALPIAA